MKSVIKILKENREKEIKKRVEESRVPLEKLARLAKRAREAGVEVQLDIWEDMIHVFQAYAVIAPESIEGINKIGGFIKKFF